MRLKEVANKFENLLTGNSNEYYISLGILAGRNGAAYMIDDVGYWHDECYFRDEHVECMDICRMNILYGVNADMERPSYSNEQRTRLIYDALCKVGDVHILDVRQQGVRVKGDPKMAVKWTVFALIIALLIFRARLFAHVQDGVKIGNLRRIGVYAVVLKGVAIGEGAVVVEDAFVTKDVEPYAIVGGVPARKIGERVHGFDYNCRLPEWFV